MTQLNLRSMVMASAFAGSMLVGPTESKAIFHWCRGCGTAAPAAPAYIPPPAQPAVSYYAPCAPPTVVNYVPQTYFRPVVVNTPVTSYQPVTRCGLCGPATTMRPVTTMVQQTQYVPYNSYRLVYSAAYPAYTTNYLAPAPMAMPVAPPAAPACCGQAAPAVAAPAMSGITPAPSLYPPSAGMSNYGPPAPGYTAPGYTAPANAAPGYATPAYTDPAASGTSNYGAPAGGTSTFAAPTPGGSTSGTGTSGTSNYSSPAPATSNSPSTPATGGPAPAFDPSQPSPPEIKFNPVPEAPGPQAGPASAPRRESDADARTAARPISATAATPASTGVVQAVYAEPAATTTSSWRPSSR